MRRGVLKAEVRNGRLAVPDELAAQTFGGGVKVYVLRVQSHTEIWGVEAFESYRRPLVGLQKPR